MNKKEFYEILESQIQISDSWSSILTGNERDDSGFYELCASFASYTDSEICSEEVIQVLREHVICFCQKHDLTIDIDLFNLINRCYLLLLTSPPDGSVISEIREYWQEGGHAFDLNYHSTIPTEIWEAIFGNSMYE